MASEAVLRTRGELLPRIVPERVSSFRGKFRGSFAVECVPVIN